MRKSFQKDERLCSQKLISHLFNKSDTIAKYPLRLLWVSVPKAENTHRIQILITVPKKNFKKAHDRNRQRRRVKEAWRLHKQVLIDKIESRSDEYYAMALLFTAKEEMEFDQVEQAVLHLIRHFPVKRSDNSETNTR